MLLILISLLFPFISTTSFYVLSDLHLDPNYSPNITPDQNLCRGNGISNNLSKVYEEYPILLTHKYKSLESNTYGQFGCDSPHELIQIMLDQVLKLDKQPDIIYLPGDFVGHGYSQDVGPFTSNETYNFLLDIHYKVIKEIKLRFPNTLIIPAVGNNDPEFHYQVPDVETKYGFYDFLFDTWFLNHIPNSRLSNLNEIKSTFLEGGYYKVDYNSELSIFSLNTLYYSKKNNEENDPSVGMEQLNWLRSQLAEIKANQPNKKVIFTYHVLPGYKYDGSAARMWEDNYVVIFDQILQEYNDIILTIVAGHTHTNSLRAYKQEATALTPFLGAKPSYGTTIVCPSVTPIYLNNPGFTSITLEENLNTYKINMVKFTYLNLEKLNSDSKIAIIKDFSSYFFDVNVKKEYGLADFSAEAIGGFIGRMKNDDVLLKKFLVYSVGFPMVAPYSDDALKIYSEMGLVSGGDGNWSLDSSEKHQFICILKHMKQEDYKAC